MISDFLAYLIVYCPLITTVCLFSPNAMMQCEDNDFFMFCIIVEYQYMKKMLEWTLPAFGFNEVSSGNNDHHP